MNFIDGIGTPALTNCRLTPMPQSITIGVSFTTIRLAGFDAPIPTRGPPFVPRKTIRVRGLAICACTVEAASAATPDTASLSMSRRSIMKSSRPIVLTSLTPAQHAVENRQAEDHRKRDQRVADRAKRRFAGAAEQRCAELDSQRI